MRSRFIGSVSVTVILIMIPATGQSQSVQAKSAGVIEKGWTPPRTPDGKPDLQGVWSFGSRTPLDRSEIPPLTAEGQKRAAARQAALKRSAGPEDRSLPERCILGYFSGPPMIPTTFANEDAYNSNVQIFQTERTVAFLNQMIHNARIVPTDGRPHGTIRQWVGDSRGHWEGQTLVVDTINFTDNGTGLFRIPTDENFHLTERFTLRDANTLIYEFTVDDPTVQTKPWTASVRMARSDEAMSEYACHEGNYGIVGILAGARAQEKAAQGSTK